MLNCNSAIRIGLYAIVLMVIALGQACAPVKEQELAESLPTNAARKSDVPTLPAKARPPAEAKPVVDAESLVKILVIGDSLGNGVGHFLRERVRMCGIHATVINAARSSTGLARADFYDWPANFKSLAATHVPDFVVVHVGANDMQCIMRPQERVHFRTPEWDDAYREEIRKILKVAADVGAKLYWLGPGPDRNPKLNRHLTNVNPLFKAETEASKAIYIPLSKFAAQPEGGYQRTINIDGKTVIIRSGDGSHFTGIGYMLIADQLLAEMQRQAPSMFGTGCKLFAASQ